MTRRTFLRAAAVVAAWTALGVLTGQQTQLQLRLRGEERAIQSVFGPALTAMWLWAAFTPAAVAATRRLRGWRERETVAGWLGWAVGHALAAATLSGLAMALYVLVRPLIDGVTVRFASVVSYGLVTDLMAYAAIVVVAEAAHFAALYRERDRAAAELAQHAAALRIQLTEARLQALEAQLQPHFIYNTLNVIAELVHDDPAAADRMVTQLGALLRRAYRDRAHFVTLDEEVRFVRAYVDILLCRYAGRVTVEVEVEEAARGVPVPTFVLQPLVENAFRHGVERREGATSVVIAGSIRGGALVLTVLDHPSDDASDDAAPLGTCAPGVGLRNTRARLATLYGDDAGVALESEGRGAVCARLWLPVRTAAHDGMIDGAAPEHGADADRRPAPARRPARVVAA
jgi:hypothetical protein